MRRKSGQALIKRGLQNVQNGERDQYCQMFQRGQKKRSGNWMCPVLLGDLDKNISGRGGGNGSESTEIKNKGAWGSRQSKSNKSLAHSWAREWGNIQLALKLEGQWICGSRWCSILLCNLWYGTKLYRDAFPIFPLLPGVEVIKVPESMKDREGGALECGDTRYPATLARRL